MSGSRNDEKREPDLRKLWGLTMAKLEAEFSINLKILDQVALIQAGRKRAMKHGYAKNDKEARECVPDVKTASLMLLDPGRAPPGTEILDSGVELSEK